MPGPFNLSTMVLSCVPPLKKAEEVEEAPAKEIRTALRKVPHTLAEASISLLLRTDNDPPYVRRATGLLPSTADLKTLS